MGRTSFEEVSEKVLSAIDAVRREVGGLDPVRHNAAREAAIASCGWTLEDFQAACEVRLNELRKQLHPDLH